MRFRVGLVLGLITAGVVGPALPVQAVDGYFCAGENKPQVCLHQISGFGGQVREYGFTTGGPAGTGDESYRVEVLCGGGSMAVRVGETEHGLGLGLGFRTVPIVVPSLLCPDVFPTLP